MEIEKTQLTAQIRELRTKLADPIDKAEESLSKFGEVAAAIADCDEKHPVIQLYRIKQKKPGES
jgi:hypothetical protein